MSNASHIQITPTQKRVKVTWRGAVIADSGHALELREGSYPAAFYIPRADADMTKLVKTAHSTHCPHKGAASYFSIRVGDAASENAIWSYETPNAGVAAIKDHLAFYPSRVDAIDVG